MIITKPDKGTGVVVLNKADYVDKMHQILDNNALFSRQTGDLMKNIVRLEDKSNRVVDQLHKNGCFDEHVKNSLKASGSRPGIMYGLPKIHKQDTPVAHASYPLHVRYF